MQPTNPLLTWFPSPGKPPTCRVCSFKPGRSLPISTDFWTNKDLQKRKSNKCSCLKLKAARLQLVMLCAFYLVHAIVQGNRGHVFNVLAVFSAPQFYQQVVPLSVIDPNLGEAQRRHQLLPQPHFHADVLLTHLDDGEDYMYWQGTLN